MSPEGERCVVGIDFGTLSGRAVVVRVSDGAELGSAVHEYESAVIDDVLPASGAKLPPDWALQDPDDYISVLRNAVPAALRAAGVEPEQVVGIGTDFTASTPMPVLADGTPLCKVDELRERPHAWVKLWKHHAAQSHADRITSLAAERGEWWLPRYGGRISSEWEFAKALQVLEEDAEVYGRTERWIEAADWIVWQLCGRETRNICTAGYKAIHQDEGYPSPDYLAALNPDFAGFVQEKLEHPLSLLGDRAGSLTRQASEWTTLPEGIAVAVGNVDAHVTSPAAKAIQPGQMLAVMGTSTCHVMNGDHLAEVPGMCGVVHNGIVPGLYGYEAGQSGVGDIFGWYVEQGVPPAYHEAARERGLGLHEHLSDLASRQRIGEHGLVALDWHSGNRSVLVDHELSGMIVGLTLSTKPEEIYRALLEATAFGTRKIIEAFEAAGLPVDELVVAGGLLKNPFLMQIYADVTRKELSLIVSDQGPALGSAMHAAVAAGCYPDIEAATEAMGKVRRAAYTPDPKSSEAYDALYAEYDTLHDYFGRGANEVMHKLRAIRREARA
ncbi:MAG TPA: ribulokinase [Solirubrobacteraceae bacterium]|nr:ribulokinase [Solirubrobacteraceae bacterium]